MMTLLKPFIKKPGQSKQAGMAATEYILGLVLVAVAAIGTFAIFGSQIKVKIAQVTAAIGGTHEKYDAAKEKANTVSDEAVKRSAKNVDMSGAESEEFKFDTEGGQ